MEPKVLECAELEGKTIYLDASDSVRSYENDRWDRLPRKKRIKQRRQYFRAMGIMGIYYIKNKSK